MMEIENWTTSGIDSECNQYMYMICLNPIHVSSAVLTLSSNDKYPIIVDAHPDFHRRHSSLIQSLIHSSQS